ncbi:MMS19 nucleotide excision repair protein homolog [Aethina tumida]|uniref:MMS19 nucleotide excision repair protein homolog n=1 Tax=Aethina tumida TaxID=116153 RepID=UPI0021474374|nr:MMS19 nucleotide excision repair protein homolog [Aethina tumida]
MDLHVINELIEEIKHLDKDDVNFTKKCSKIVSDVQNNKLSILELIQSLQSLLTNPIVSKRELGILILSDVLENISDHVLNGQQLSVICNFYSDRLKDNHQVLPSTLKGILALSKFNNLPDGSAVIILTSLFNNVACQQQQQPDRLRIYNILKIFLEKHRNEIQSMGTDFVYGVMTAIDSERDPKNLLFIFKWIPTFLGAVSLGHLSEDMFEVLACYFPVDFRAAPKDPNVTATREDLSDSLCPCLCAIPEFGEHCLSLAIEKLESTLLIAKIDSLKLLELGCKNFEVDEYIQQASKIWSLIQKELLNCNNPELEKACLQTLQAVIKKLSNGQLYVFNNILKDISDTLIGNILPDAKLFEPSIKLLLHIALASRESSQFITKEVVPIIVNTYNITESPLQKCKLLEPLTGFLMASTIHGFNIADLKELNTVPLLCLKASIDESLDLKIVGYNSLSNIIKLLPLDVRKAVYNNMMLLLVTRVDFRQSLVRCFKFIAREYSDEVNVYIIDKIKCADEIALDLYLDALCEIVDLENFTSTIVKKMATLAFEGNQINHIVLNNIKKMLEKYEDNENVQKYTQEQILDKLISIIIMIKDNIEDDVDLLLTINKVLKLLIGNCAYEKQQQILETYTESVGPLKDKCPKTFITLLNGLLIRLKQNLGIDNKILFELVELSYHQSAFIRDHSIQLLANILNKVTDDQLLDSYLTHIRNICQHKLETDLNVVIEIVTWITKALAMKNSKFCNEWEDILMELLDRDAISAKGFRIIMNDSQGDLTTRSYCNIGILYKQRFFTSVVKKLSARYDNVKNSYLAATGYLIEFIPKQVLLMNFDKVKRLIVLCLERCQESDVLCVVLEALDELIKGGEQVMEDNLEDLITRFLKLTTFESSMRVRVAAIKCLQQYAGNYPVFKLLPFKQSIITQLGICIDDRKRIVRKEAVSARNSWYLLDAPI